tara:strand:- start:63 stop:524 length:462 start_codon:yes stop_codon:yes gene_type:complete
VTYKFVPATQEHVQPLIDDISPDIAEEMLQLKDLPLEESVSRCISRSDEAWTALYNGEVVCIFGIRRKSLLSDTAYPWLLSTNLVNEHKRNLLKGAKISVNKWMGMNELLENFIPAGLPKLIRFVSWLGFTVEEAKPIGQNGKLLHRIEMRKQ